MSTFNEKRAHPRYQQKAPIRFIHPDADQYIDAEMRNYSEGGMLFRSELELEPGNNICIRSPEAGRKTAAPPPRRIYMAEVRSCRPVHMEFEPMFDVGVKYLQRYSDDEWSSYWLPFQEYRKNNKALPGLTVGNLDGLGSDQLEGLIHSLRTRHTELENQIKHLRQSLEEIEASRDQYLFLYDYAPIGYFTLDRAGRILSVNRAGEKLLGTEKNGLVDTLLTRYIDVEDRDILDNHLMKILDTGQSVSCELKLGGKKETPCHVRINSSPNHDPKQGPDRILTTVSDITVRKAAEKSKKKLESLLLQVKKMESLATIAGGVAHNFNNLMMAIQGHVSVMMYDMNPTGPEYDHLKGIERMIQRATRLTRALISFAQIEKGKPSLIDLNELILNTLDLIADGQEHIVVKHELQEDIWSVEVDRNQIEQVIVNMVNNSLQAIQDNGTLSIRTENVLLDHVNNEEPGLARGRYIKVSVTDTGSGMDAITQERIFDPFFTTKDVGQGTGLGLATAYGTIEKHGGIIRVSSAVNQGTTFVIYLPASAKRNLFTIRSREYYSGAEQILFVDDDEKTRDTGAEMLIELGHPVLIAGSVREALKIFRRQYKHIDLVILDLTMPGMDGLDAYRKMVEVDSNVKILLSAEYVNQKHPNTNHGPGFLGFIQKPFQLRDLSRHIRAILDQETT